MLILEGELANLAAAHEAAFLTAYESIDSQIGLFQKMSTEADQSISDLIDSLDSQIDYLDTYAENINKAMEKGVDKGLIQKLSDGSEESAKILAAIVAGGDKDIKALNEKFGKVEEGKQKFSGTVADMETDFQTNMDAINAELDGLVKDMDKSSEAGAAARQTGESYASGLRSKRDAVYNASAALAKASNQGWKDYYIQRSPAKRAIETAAQTADSYAMGVEQRTKHMKETTGRFASAANDAYVDKMKDITIKATPVMYNLSELPQRKAVKSGDVIVHVDARGATVRSEDDIKRISDGIANKISQKLAKEAQRKITARGGKVI